mmetsp:Transcript_25634/g.55821  ORF Transcript_25634/g.55821 Transcript_25634/m.55821 type:complete len:110 (+) Transcript_25634:497-826(+)
MFKTAEVCLDEKRSVCQVRSSSAHMPPFSRHLSHAFMPPPFDAPWGSQGCERCAVSARVGSMQITVAADLPSPEQQPQPQLQQQPSESPTFGALYADLDPTTPYQDCVV